MKKTSYYYLLLLLSFSLLPGCFLFGSDDDQPAPEPIPPLAQLPPITSEGRGTFGCLVNGEAFVSYYPDAYADYSMSDNIGFYASTNRPESSLAIGLNNYNREEGYIELPDSSAVFSRYDNNLPRCYYQIEHFVQGWIDITDLNPSGEYISGTFEFTSVNETCDTLRVTNGRFDLPLVW